jgi:peptidoglycan/xylan/chitin deacetylase (PgdA/CDA1 family)
VRRIAACAGALALAAGCGSTEKSAPVSPATTHVQPAVTRPDPKAAGANELGAIPVIMFHRVTPKPASDYDLTPREFKGQLRDLYRFGYRPVSASELVTGQIDVPAGKSPVVLTFDDSSTEQFALRPDGSVDPHTAVGMLLAFSRSHRGFRPRATFFVISSLFGGSADGPRLLASLARLGFDLGDHTYDHANLGGLDETGVQKEVVLGARLIHAAVPGAKIETLALPYGVYPVPHTLALRGSWDGERYQYSGVFEVGAGPAPSPYSIDFDPLAVPRIRAAPWRGAEDLGSGYWLRYLDEHRDQRFISDGDPNRISFPSVLAGAVAEKYRSRANPY